MTQSLELKLTDEEKKDVAIRVINEHWDLLDKRLSDFTPSISALADAVGNLATAKAAWKIVRWVYEMIPDEDGVYADALTSALEAEGLVRPSA